MTSTVQYQNSLFSRLDTRSCVRASAREVAKPAINSREAATTRLEIREAPAPAPASAPVAREAAKPAADPRETVKSAIQQPGQQQGVDSFAASLLAAMLRDAAEKEELEAEPPVLLKSQAKAPAERKKVQQRPRITEEVQITEEEQPTVAEPQVLKSFQQANRPGVMSRIWGSLTGSRRPEKQLRVQETVTLGEKRFVAVLQVEGRKFLIGGGSAGVSLLTALSPNTAIGDTLQVAPALADRLQ